MSLVSSESEGNRIYAKAQTGEALSQSDSDLMKGSA
jgi:hypothetical protein